MLKGVTYLLCRLLKMGFSLINFVTKLIKQLTVIQRVIELAEEI